MATQRKPMISVRKLPKQARSSDLVAAILEAATQVLADEGAHRFTTARVAVRAGVSVGSIYQYFPNKAAILFRLQSDEWRQTAEQLRGILQDHRRPPLDRLRTLVHTFFASECDEARVRVALGDAAPLYRDAPEAREARVSGTSILQTFLQEALPQASSEVQIVAAELIETTLTQVGRRFSETLRAPREIEAYSSATADMFCAYIVSLDDRRSSAQVAVRA